MTITRMLKLLRKSSIYRYEVGGHPFFAGPNPHSAYPVNIKFKQGPLNLIKRVSPHSRFLASIVDEKNKLIIFYTYKVGSSSLKKFIKLNLQEVYTKTNFEFNNPQDIAFPNVVDIHSYLDPKKLLIKTIDWEKYKGYKKLLFMRDPLDKIVSFYLMVFVRSFWLTQENPQFKDGYILKTIGYFVKEVDHGYVDPFNISFKDFIYRLNHYYDSDIQLWDSHLSLQITPDFDLVAGHDVHLFNVSGLNNFLMDWAEINGKKREDLNMEGRNRNTLKKDIEVKNAYDLTFHDFKKMGYTPEFRSFYNDELESIVKKIYKPDYEYWNRHAEYSLDKLY